MKGDWKLYPKQEIKLNQMPLLEKLLKKTSTLLSVSGIIDGYEPKMKVELIESRFLSEEMLLESKHFTFLCSNIINGNKQYFLLLFNKLTPNKQVVRKFIPRDKNIIKSIIPKLDSCLP